MKEGGAAPWSPRGAMNRRLLMATLATTVFASALGLAAAIAMTTGSLGTGAAVTSCNADGVTVASTVTWDDVDKRFEVTAVTVSGIAGACEGDTVSVQLTGSGGGAIAGASGSATISGTSAHIALATPPAASAVEGVEIVIVK